MLTLTIRTDKPEAEIGLFSDDTQLAYVTWEAHRQLAETIHLQLDALLDSCSLSLNELDSVALYQGPGSFTGLRIGIAVGNAIAAARQIAIVGEAGEAAWIERCLSRLTSGDDDKVVIPVYGAEVHITPQKK